MMDGIVLYINVKTDDKKENPANGKRYKINNIKTCMQQLGASLPHTQVNINDFPSVANNLLTECWDTGACSVTRVTWLHDEVLSGCMTRACWCMTKCSLSALASAEQVPVRGGASTARAAEPGCNKRWRAPVSTQYIYTIYTIYRLGWAGRACSHNFRIYPKAGPRPRSGAGWTMDGTGDSWLVG